MEGRGQDGGTLVRVPSPRGGMLACNWTGSVVQSVVSWVQADMEPEES